MGVVARSVLAMRTTRVSIAPVETLRRTPLYDRHVASGGRMVPFAGWELPVQYDGVIAEHRAVRTDAGVFDVSHMGEIEIEGPTAAELLQGLLSNDIARLEPGEAQYTLLTNERGGIIDDLIVYRTGTHRFLLVVNAANTDADFAWLAGHELRGSDVRDVSDEYALLAVQGPGAIERLGLEHRPAFTWEMGEIDGIEVMVNRTGYTGEEGVELVSTPDDAPALWDAIVARDIVPCGLGAGTRSASRSAIRCTGTTSARSGTRSRAASAGSARSIRSSPAPRRCARSRRGAPSASSSRSR